MFGPGKYDDLCTYVRTESKARGAIVIVFDGDKGQGFSAQLDIEDTLKMPSVLRAMADDIEASFKAKDTQVQ
jgi:hypothetical protein